MADGAMVPVQRAELVTQDMELLADVVKRAYREHAARLRCPDPAEVHATVSRAAVNGLSAGKVLSSGVEYTAEVPPFGALMVLTVRCGGGVLAATREEVRYTAGEVFLCPLGQPCFSRNENAGLETVQIPVAVARSLAEERTGLPAADLRFEAMTPVSAAMRRAFARTSEFIWDQLVASGAAGIHPLVVHEMTRLAAAAMLETFPNTAMTASYLPGPEWVTPVAVRRAAAFIDAHASQLVTLSDISAAAGVSGRALQHAFARHYGVTPTQYLRRVRLEHAHDELAAAEPGAGVTVAAVASRWGWASQAQFAAVYQLRFGELPSRTLRT